MIVGIIIIVNSVFKLQTSLELRSFVVRIWWTVLVLSVISIAVAVFLIRNPFEGSLTLTVYLGVCLVIDSIQSLVFVHHNRIA